MRKEEEEEEERNKTMTTSELYGGEEEKEKKPTKNTTQLYSENEQTEEETDELRQQLASHLSNSHYIYETYTKSMNDEKGALKEEIKNIQKTKRALAMEVDALRGMTEKVKNVQEANETLKTTLATQKRKMDALTYTNQFLQDQLNQLRENHLPITEAQRQLDDKEQQRRDAQEETDDHLQRMNDQLKADIRQLLPTFTSDLETKLLHDLSSKENDSPLTKLEHQIILYKMVAQSKIESFALVQEELKNQLLEAQKVVETKEREMHHVQDDLKQQQRHYEHQKTTYADKLKKLSKLFEVRTKEQDGRIQRMATKVDEQQDALKKTKAQLHDQEVKVHEQQTEIDFLEAKLVDQESARVTLAASLAEEKKTTCDYSSNTTIS
mmetsp:Transcript_10575/g.15477  ORF Transcript_10575/g.15477 Transcript_10575/m.15477 type:complete len:381 (+) Transcript_10575:10-1152(+)